MGWTKFSTVLKVLMLLLFINENMYISCYVCDIIIDELLHISSSH